MRQDDDSVRVLYSFPHKLGADRICSTAWEQVNGLAKAGANVLVFPSVLHKPFEKHVNVRPTLARGKLRISYKLFGTMRACSLHDRIVAKRIEKMVGQIDIVHTWPLGSLQTLKTSNRLGIPTVLERPNAHTRFAYDVVQKECKRIGVPLPPSHEHAYNKHILKIEEEEYKEAFRLLCPSEFTKQTFLDHGFDNQKLMRHIYGVDEKRFYPDNTPRDPTRALTMLSVGVCAVRKGIHFALEAWLKSPASNNGRFLIAGEFFPGYKKELSDMLDHPSVEVLGHRNDVPELMRKSDILVLASIEEGFGLVCTEAMASGCVPLVSEACTDICQHMKNSLVHPIGNIDSLSRHITMLHEDRSLLERLREASLRDIPNITWRAAGEKLLKLYREVIKGN